MHKQNTKYRVDTNIELKDFSRALGLSGINLENCPDKIAGISTDTRCIEKGDVFFAIKGENFNGNLFLDQAIDNGAAFCIYSESDNKIPGFKVKDTVEALGKVAKKYRESLKATVVGITGSNGKTTTKNILASILSRKSKTVKSQASFNNNIGLPLTILGTPADCENLVLELGMNHEGEIAYLCDISKPDIGLITNIGPVHLEFLGSIEGVAKAKKELFDSLSEKGWAVINADDYLVVEASKNIRAKKYCFSSEKDSDLHFDFENGSKGSSDEIRISTKENEFTAALPLKGIHNAYNAAAAISIGLILGASQVHVANGLAGFENDSKRFQIIDLGTRVSIIDDCYNANPVSTEAALRYVAGLKGKKIFVMGDMLELGVHSEKYHKKIGEVAANLEFSQLFLYGDKVKFIDMEATKKNIKSEVFDNFEKLSKKLIETLKSAKEKTTVLIKGSRGMQMENVTEMLLKAGKEFK